MSHSVVPGLVLVSTPAEDTSQPPFTVTAVAAVPGEGKLTVGADGYPRFWFAVVVSKET